MRARYQNAQVIVGLDYGSKLAGTSVLAISKNRKIEIFQSEKKRDADKFILSHLGRLSPGILAIDAPLSLPGVYLGLEDCTNYHFRHCDLELKAMSPMFLGGLTARAMSLSAKLRALGWTVIETYPSAIAKRYFPPETYIKTKGKPHPEAINALQKLLFPFAQKTDDIPANYHQFDANLALFAAMKYTFDQAATVSGVDGTIYL